MIKKAEYFAKTGLKVFVTECLYKDSCWLHGNHVGEVTIKCADGNFGVDLDNGNSLYCKSFRLVERYPRVKLLLDRDGE